MNNLNSYSKFRGSCRRKREAGVALIVAIVGLLLITAVAAGMILVSNSETNVDANYRDQQVALFAAKAGLEEARDRVLKSNPANIALPCILPSGIPTAGCATNFSATYITAPGVTPWAAGSTLSTGAGNVSVYDQEYLAELAAQGLPAPAGAWYVSSNTSATYSGATNPLPYQWVRINLKLNATIDPATGTPHWVNNTNGIPPTAQVLYDPGSQTQCVAGTAAPSPCATSSNLQPVYEITSYAVTKNGSRRMIQDEVAAVTLNLNFPSPLTIPGPLGAFNPPNSANYCMDGNDTTGVTSIAACSKFTPPPAPPGGCGAPTAGGPAVAVSPGDINGSTTTTNSQYVTNQIPRPGNYPGNTGSTPSVGTPALPPNISSPAALQQELQLVEQNSNVCITPSASSMPSCPSPTVMNPGSGGNYTYSQLVSAMPGGTWPNSNDNPQVIVVDGNVDITGNTTGSGILVVTGNLTYDGNSSWNGIIMVVGDGLTTYVQNGGGNGQFNGAIFVANTAGPPPGSYGPADFTINGGGGNGLYYNSCWIQSAQKPIGYILLSSKEVAQ